MFLFRCIFLFLLCFVFYSYYCYFIFVSLLFVSFFIHLIRSREAAPLDSHRFLSSRIRWQVTCTNNSTHAVRTNAESLTLTIAHDNILFSFCSFVFCQWCGWLFLRRFVHWRPLDFCMELSVHTLDTLAPEMSSSDRESVQTISTCFIHQTHRLFTFCLRNGCLLCVGCSKLEKKSFYPIFQLAGFASFDGQWQE